MDRYKNVDVSSFNLEVGGTKVKSISIPDGYVIHNFRPLVDEHTLVTGDLLLNGMVVILADSIGRRDPDCLTPEYKERNPGWKGPTSSDLHDLMTNSRWAIVSNIQRHGHIINFDAIYADGTIYPRSYSHIWKWAVMKQVEIIPEDAHDASDKAFNQAMIDAFDVISGNKFDPNFIENFLKSVTNPVRGFVDDFDLSGLVLDPDRFSLKRMFGEESTPQVPPVSRTNWKRRLRDANSLKQVKDILKERDDFMQARREAEMIELAENNEADNPEHLLTISAKELILGDVFVIAGSWYQVISLCTLEGFEDEIEVDTKMVGTTWPKTLSFKLDETIQVAQRS